MLPWRSLCPYPVRRGTGLDQIFVRKALVDRPIKFEKMRSAIKRLLTIRMRYAFKKNGLNSSKGHDILYTDTWAKVRIDASCKAVHKGINLV